MNRLLARVETQRELDDTALNIYLSMVSNRLNQIMKLLSIITCIFLPLSLVAGIYGMNFDYLIPPSDENLSFFVVLGFMAVLGLSLLGLFKWKKWL